MALYILLVFSVSTSAVMHEGFGLPVMNQSAGNAPHRQRTKRCSCVYQLDAECHYFCHLDIIWVNTPSKTTVYGLGSPLARRRRSADRCLCANPADQTCTTFCILSSGNTAVLPRSSSDSPKEKTDVALENLNNADSFITQGSVNEAPVEFWTFLRTLSRARAKASKTVASARQKSLRQHKPGLR